MRRAVLVVGQPETAVARAQRDRAASGERYISAFDQTAIDVDGFRTTVKAPDTLAGLDAIPAPDDDRSHLDDAERSHHRIAGVVAPGEADTLRVASSFDHHVEKVA